MKDTGLPQQDAQSDFARQRRRLALSRIVARLRFEPDDVSSMLPFEEVVAALGRLSQRDIGLQSIRLDSVVGTVARRHNEFDRKFRPTSTGRAAGGSGSRPRAGAATRCRRSTYIASADCISSRMVTIGCQWPRAMGDTHIDAYVKEVRTAVGAGADLKLGDLPLKRHERIFRERVPLAPALRDRIELSDEWRYAELSVLIEAWGLRASYAREQLLSRAEIAEAWFHEEYEPVVQVLNEAHIGGEGTETERYLRIAMLRYLLLTTHEWSDDVVERLLGEVRPPSDRDDTMVHQILKELS